MTAALDHADTAHVPSAEDTELANVASRALARANRESLSVKMPDGEELVLPQYVTSLLSTILTEMANGNSVTILPLHAELTTQEAANLLNVSRPHLVKMIDEGAIAHHMIGTHRRVKLTDLETYRAAFDVKRKAALTELAAQGQELGMGY